MAIRPKCGQSGYTTPTVSGSPTQEEKADRAMQPKCGQNGYITP